MRVKTRSLFRALSYFQDSNQFHAVCLDTYPPIFYMTDISKKIVSIITKYNAKFDSPKVAYTFDAGPNAVLYCEKESIQTVKSLINYYFPCENSCVLFLCVNWSHPQ